MTTSTRRNKRNNESGNVFLIILLGVVLFGALAFTVSRSLRTTTTEAMSSRDADLAASDIMSYAQSVERAVNTLRRKGISENDISFENSVVTGYAHTPVVPATSRVFNASGGDISWRSPPPGANNASQWHFTGASCIVDLGTGTSTCGTDGASNEELLATLLYVNSTVCERINKRLGITGIPADAGDGPSALKFTGPLADGTTIQPGSPHNAACLSYDINSDTVDDYYFYYVLIAR